MATLGSLLVRDQIVGVTQIEQALQHQVIYGGDLATNMLELGLVDEKVLTEYAARSLNLPVLSRDLLENPDLEAVRMLPWNAVAAHRVVPIRVEDNIIVLATAGPLSVEEIGPLATLVGLGFEPRFALDFRLAMALNRYYGLPIPARLKVLLGQFAPTYAPDQPPVVPRPAEGAVVPAEWRPSKTQTSLVPKPVAAPTSEPPPESPILDVQEARALLEKAETRDEVLSLFLEHAHRALDFAALFVIHGRTGEGSLAMRGTDGAYRIDDVSVPLDRGGMFQTAYETRSFYLGSSGTQETDIDVLSALGRERPRNCAILPVTLRDRVILLLYGDCGALGVQAEHLADLSQLTRIASEAFARLLLKRKYGNYRKPTAAVVPKPAHQAMSQVPVTGRGLAGWAGRYHVKSEDVESGRVRQPAAEPPAGQRTTDQGIRPGDRPGTYASTSEFRRVDSVAPPPHRPSAPPWRRSSAPPPRRSSAPPPRPVSEPPIPRSSIPPAVTDMAGVRAAAVVTVSGPALPRTVVITMDEEIERLVERALATDRFDSTAVDLLVGIGEDSLKKLIARFPGPLLCDRYQETGKLRRVGQHGPLLKALIRFGQNAVPYLLPLLESPDANVRFYATFLFSELPFPEALGGLTARLFDGDRQIRALAIDVIKGMARHPEYRWAMRELVATLKVTGANMDAKRVAAEVLGELRESAGVGVLAESMLSVDGVLVERCHRALCKITFNDFGFSGQRWMEWWSTHKRRHRIEWAIEALTHAKEPLRRAAFEELRRMVGPVVEWPITTMDQRQRTALQREVRSWWEREGSALFPVTEEA